MGQMGSVLRKLNRDKKCYATLTLLLHYFFRGEKTRFSEVDKNVAKHKITEQYQIIANACYCSVIVSTRNY
jgi:hypothetical protein